MKRKPRYSIEPTVRGFIVMDNLMNMRKLGPFDGKATTRSTTTTTKRRCPACLRFGLRRSSM